jgi:hypothetical protein
MKNSHGAVVYYLYFASHPFFFKQWGGRNKKAAGRMLGGRTWGELPEVQRSAARTVAPAAEARPSAG